MGNNPSIFTDPLGLMDGDDTRNVIFPDLLIRGNAPWWFSHRESWLKSNIQNGMWESEFFGREMEGPGRLPSVRYGEDVAARNRQLDREDADRRSLQADLHRNSVLNGIQTTLDVAGLVPGIGEVADGINALIYLARGDYVNAAMSTAAMVPFVGGVATGGKYLGKIGKRVTVVGEGMARVETAASKIPGSKILNDMPTFTGKSWQVTSQMMQYNRQWILKEMRSGRTIIDIGRDLNRANPSIFYQMEQNMIKYYEKLHPGSLNIVKP